MKKYLLAVFSFLTAVSAGAKDYSVSSPDGHLQAYISDAGKVSWSIVRDDVTILQPSTISITTANGAWGEGTRFKKVTKHSVLNTLDAINYKSSKVVENYNEVVITCSGDWKAFIPYVNDNRAGERYSYSFESYYDEQKLSAMYADSLAITPLAVCLPDGMKAVVMETAVENYPGMFLYRNASAAENTLLSDFAPLPLETVIGGFDRLNLLPVKRGDFIAAIPTTFDETVPVCGEMGEYVAVARRKGSVWYVVRQVSDSEILTVNLAPGGGWAALFK